MARSNRSSFAFSRPVQRRLKPVAQAAVVIASLWGAQHDGWAAGVAVRLAMPYLRPTAIDTSRLLAPTATQLPKTVVDLSKGNVAQSGNVTGVETGGNTLTLTQTTSRAQVLFNSFDIGSAATLNVDYGTTATPGSSGWSSMFLVSNSTAPSQIYGRLNTSVVAADGSRSTGGEVFLINANGILFGQSAVVNVGGLFASTLSPDLADYNAGLTNSINSANSSFKWVSPDGIATYAPESAFVKVADGAQITTASGGRVFLLGGQVENAGSISTPNGQTVLAAGSSVFLSNPTDVDSSNKASTTSLYLSEANDKVPTVKGLLVEVNGAQTDSEFATNSATGRIATPTGNTTIVGWAVNQLGRVSATTSVTQNGSVYLLARSGATGSSSSNTKLATVGGNLMLGATSVTEVLPDSTPDASGKVVTAAANAVFTPSRIELSGQAITLDGGAQVVAPGGTVNVRASVVPSYLKTAVPDVGVMADGDTSGTISMGAGATIDVSGTNDTTVSVARNFVTTALLGAQDLKDAPLQKDGPIYRSELTFDIRSGSPILNDTSSYTNGVQKSVGEFMAKAGNVVLSATGQVDLAAGSHIKASGGTVTYTDAWVKPSILMAEDGKTYTLNTAPADVVYVGIAGKDTGASTRFGKVATPDASTLGHLEVGYTEGKAAGAIAVYAPVAHLDGRLSAKAVTGTRQKAGLDPLAAAGSLTLGTSLNQSGGNVLTFGAGEFATTVMNELFITADNATVDDAYSRIAASTITAGGFGKLAVSANRGITQQAGAAITLPNVSTVSLQSLGQVTLGANITSLGGSITAGTYDTASLVSKGVTLQSGAKLDVSGNWVNQRLDGSATAAAVAAGKVTLRSDHSLVTQDGSTIDASGGATVTSAGGFSGTSAGAITLEGLNGTVLQGDEVVSLKGKNLGHSLGTGGKLRIKTGSIVIDGDGNQMAMQGNTGMTLGSAFFNEGGFLSFDLDGRTSLTLTANAQLTPTQAIWQAKAAGRNAATGSHTADFMAIDTRTDTVRKTVNVALASSGLEQGAGHLTMAQGASLVTGPQATVTLQAAQRLDIDGTVRTMGGTINAKVATKSEQTDDRTFLLNVGDHAVLDVSGGVVVTPTNNGLTVGQVLQGGNIVVGVTRTNQQSDATVVVAEKAQLLAHGGTGQLDVARPKGSMGPAYTRQLVASDGGNITLQGGSGGMTLAGTFSAAGGNASASGGSLTVQMGDLTVKGSELSEATQLMVDVQAGAATAPSAAGRATLSAKAVSNGGFANLNLAALHAVNFNAAGGDVNLQLPAHLLIDTPVLGSDGVGSVTLKAGSTAQIGNSQILANAPVATGGKAKLDVSSGMIELFGQQATQGLGTIALTATQQLSLRGVGVSNTARSQGGLTTGGDLIIKAAQVTPTTGTDYTISSPKDVTFLAGDPKAATILSAQSTLTVDAATIHQHGVLRAPFGKINLHASEQLVLGAGSETSVSGAGLLVPYGATTNASSAWQYNGETQTSVLDKAITLNAGDQTVTANTGATLNLDGGGELVAYEFVPGPGGSKDIFKGAASGAFAIVPTVTGYAPYDAQIMMGNGDVLSQNPSASNVLSLGNTITFGPGSMVPAGTYAILPARYALLAGAFLVQPNAATGSVAMGYTQTRADGTQIVAAQRGTAGVALAGNALPAAFTVMSSAQARRYSEVRATDVNTFLAQQADLNGAPVGSLTSDAGRLALLGSQLQYDATTLMKAAAGGRGGQLDIASNAIQIGGDAPKAGSGTLYLSEAQINRIGASSVLVGGLRADADANGVQTVTGVADTVKVMTTSGQALQVPDFTLAAGCDTCTQSALSVADGVRIEATALSDGVSTAAPSLAFKGDGAVLRVSTGTASTTRTGVARQVGTLDLGAGLTLSGGTVVADATANTTLSAAVQRASVVKADKLVLGASRIVLGTGTDAITGDTPLVISEALASQLNATRALTLRSYSAIDLLGTTQLGASTMASLTVDAPQLRLQGEGASATLTAGQVTIANTSNGVGGGDGGTGRLHVLATGLAGGSGHIALGHGHVAVSGVQTTTLDAAGSIVATGAGGLSVPGDLTMKAQSLTATQGAQTQLAATGALSLTGVSGTTSAVAATAGSGAGVSLSGASVSHGGLINLPSGSLTVKADQSVDFSAASVTNLAGQSKVIDGVTLTTMGGSLRAQADNGSITLASGSVVDVSAAGGQSTAGSMSFSAPNGRVDLLGRLVATSAAGQVGGSLKVDSTNAQDLTVLAARIAAETSSTLSNFSQAISLRNRQGDQSLAQGTTLSAKAIELSADSGQLLVDGQLLASADPNGNLAGGSVSLNAGGDVVLGQAARIRAAGGSAGSAGQVSLSTRTGSLKLSGGSIDTSGPVGQGVVNLRALRNGTDVKIDAIDTQLTGVGVVNVEAYKAYSKTTLKDADVTTMRNEATTYLAKGNASTVANKLGGTQPGLASKVNVRAGVEINAPGTLTLNTTNIKSGLALTTYDSAGKVTTNAPINLTIRAGGNLNVATSISEGFTTTTTAGVPQVDGGGNIRLVAGADLTAANLMATNASNESGDLNIGATSASTSVLVRSTTGNIQLAAGRDVNLLNAGAAVYTTGQTVATTTGYAKPVVSGTTLFGSTKPANPFLTGGGSISVEAQRDVAWLQTGSQQIATNWAYRFRTKASSQISWWSRYDLFKQGLATMGGGDIAIRAGRDAWNVNAMAANSGYVDGSGNTVSYGGGSVSLQAGRDVVGGTVGATGNLTVVAGRSVDNTSTDNNLSVDRTPANNLTLVMGDGANRVLARNTLTLDAMTLVGRLKAAIATPVGTAGQMPGTLQRPLDQASLELAATAGDLAVLDHSNATLILPGSTTMSAAGGSLNVGGLRVDAEGTNLGPDAFTQLAAPQTSLNLLAQGSVITGAITQLAADTAVQTVTSTQPVTVNGLVGSGSSPTRVVGETGNVNYGTLNLLTPLRLMAGQNVGVNPYSPEMARLQVQHQSATDLSVIQAGRDVNVGDAFGADVNGPGDLLVVAGRHVNLGKSAGLNARGNLSNRNLPTGSANITVLDGVTLSATGDIGDAVAAGYPLLGGQGMGAYPLLTLVQLSGEDGSGLTAEQWLAKAHALAGDDTYNALAWAFVNHRQSASLSQADALAQVGKLSSALQVKLAGQVLAKVWSQKVSADKQTETVLRLAFGSDSAAKAEGIAYSGLDNVNALPDGSQAGHLVSWVRERTGQAGLSGAQAWQAFRAMSVQEQALYVTRAVNVDVARAINIAADLSGAAKDAAYEGGYDALTTVFNRTSGVTANVSLSASQIKTLQGSSISLYAPNGGVNVGQLTADANAKTAADLGIVTAGGGSVNVMVRDDVAVNTSRIFTLIQGDEVLWSSLGNVDAGRGAKTVSSTPAPVYYLDGNGQLQVDVSSAINGSGILATGNGYIAAPKGEINAGDAGISATKGLTLAAQLVRGADAIAAPSLRGTPPPPPVNLALNAPTVTQPTAAGGDNTSKDEGSRTRRKRRNLMLEFLGFGVEDK